MPIHPDTSTRLISGNPPDLPLSNASSPSAVTPGEHPASESPRRSQPRRCRASAATPLSVTRRHRPTLSSVTASSPQSRTAGRSLSATAASRPSKSTLVIVHTAGPAAAPTSMRRTSIGSRTTSRNFRSDRYVISGYAPARDARPATERSGGRCRPRAFKRHARTVSAKSLHVDAALAASLGPRRSRMRSRTSRGRVSQRSTPVWDSGGAGRGLSWSSSVRASRASTVRDRDRPHCTYASWRASTGTEVPNISTSAAGIWRWSSGTILGPFASSTVPLAPTTTPPRPVPSAIAKARARGEPWRAPRSTPTSARRRAWCARSTPCTRRRPCFDHPSLAPPPPRRPADEGPGASSSSSSE
mmetsp:Transcript_10362/g.44968  ORF Transcript_10362/g.44968 Transcript_10362/m.44968 type:complete len:358 (-) Transcript_10362:56-1129(-)